MEKNEAFRKQVLSRLYGISDTTESAQEESSEKDKSEDKKDKDEEKKDDKPVKEESSEDTSDTKKKDDKGEKKAKDDKSEKIKDDKSEEKVKDEESEKDASEDKTDREKDESDEDKVKKDKDDVKTDHSNNNKDTSAVPNDNHDKTNSNSSSKSNVTHTTPTTTTSHLYSVLMAPLDGRSPYRDHNLRSSSNVDHDSEASQRKRMRLDNSENVKSEPTTESKDHADNKTTENTNSNVGMDLSKNQKKKLKKKKRKHLLNRLEVQRAKEFIYSSENEQYSVEKLRTMIEDVTEFLDAIWDVYCSEARVKGESVEEDGFKVAAVLKCLSASGEGSWGDLQLLSRAKSVLVLRSKNLAASTIARVENELGYDTDVRNFIVRMLKFWMDHVVTKG